MGTKPIHIHACIIPIHKVYLVQTIYNYLV